MSTRAFPFLELPAELREDIYEYYFDPTSQLVDRLPSGQKYRFDLRLLRANKQIRREALRVFRRLNVFVRVETPWPETEDHIANEGGVAIVATGRPAKLFTHHHSLVQVVAPLLGFSQYQPQAIILHLNDLPLFSRIWFYSALNYPTLNGQVKITWTLQDPWAVDGDKSEISLALQRKLLLPFDRIKGLYEAEVVGYDPTVEEELRNGMAVPYDPPERCLDESTRLLEEGNQAMEKKNYQRALELFEESFYAMHIIIEGRDRNVMADPFFHKELDSGRYEGQIGTAVRVILRVRLVARFVEVYLRLKQWEEAIFWGMRTVRIMREQMGVEFEDFLEEFAALPDVGLIYLRTAIALKIMEDVESPALVEYRDANCGELFDMAKRYIRDDSMINRELESHHVTREAVAQMKRPVGLDFGRNLNFGLLELE